jgi:GT2 family glycosyltransferase
MMFARAAFFRGFTGFRDDFFMYFEDVELCARAIRAGKRVMVQPTAVVENLDPPSSAPSTPAAEFHKIKNLFAIYLLHGSAAVLPAFFLRYGFIAVLRSPFSASGRLRMKALLWIARNLPRLLADRRRARGLEATTLRTKLAEAV